MEYESKLPAEQRMFLDLQMEFDVYKCFLAPIGFYLIWISFYFTVNFLISAKRIRERNYDTMFVYYEQQPWARKILYQLGPSMAPVIFLSAHFLFFLLCHCVSQFCFYSYYYHTTCIVFWLSWSVWNASCFYMDYFSKKYDASL